MKKNQLLYIITLVGIACASCDDFLDEVPDNRAEINTGDKITRLLVSAYPTATEAALTELASDNVMDNGARYNQYVDNIVQEQAYLWENMEGTNDSPYAFWEACYNAAAAANQALASIEEMGNPAELQAQKGEALMCRAFAHFKLANVFCLPYNPSTADKDMGIPYAEKPESTVKPNYQRGTLAETYKKINADIEAGLPLINDLIYKVPKYHFNKKAAYAFAARFNLFYQQWDQVDKYATVVLGDNPVAELRSWLSIINAAGDYGTRAYMYIDASERANLLICPVISSWGIWTANYYNGQRYAHGTKIASNETVGANGPWSLAGGSLYMANSVWGPSTKNPISKITAFFEYIDKAAGIGYLHTVLVNFYTDETLLCRAEANALSGNLDKAVDDINAWVKSNTSATTNLTKAQIIDFYKAVNYMETDTPDKHTVKKHLHPVGFTVEEGSDQEQIIQCILHLRRLTTMHEGMRWFDVKRYGIEIVHNRDGRTPDVLTTTDLRRALQLPADIINAGLKPNPR